MDVSGALHPEHSTFDEELHAALIPKPDELPLDFANIKYSCYSFKSISGGLRKSDFPGVRCCSPVKIARHLLSGKGQPLIAAEASTKLTTRFHESNENAVQSESSEVCFNCSIIGDDFISSKFKWASSQNNLSMTDSCPRSFDVVGDCPICKVSTRKSKADWKSIYEINLSQAIPLVKEVAGKEEKLVITRNPKNRTKTIAIDALGKGDRNGQEHSHGILRVNVEGGRTVSWAGHHKIPVHKNRDDHHLPTVESPVRPHTTGSMNRLTSNSNRHRGGSHSPGKNHDSLVSRQSSSAISRQESGIDRHGSPMSRQVSIASNFGRQHSHYSRQRSEISGNQQDIDAFDSGKGGSLAKPSQTASRPASCHGRISSGGDSPGKHQKSPNDHVLSRSVSGANQHISEKNSRPSSAVVSSKSSVKLLGSSGKLKVDTGVDRKPSGLASPQSPPPIPLRAISNRGLRLPLVMISTRALPLEPNTIDEH